jgi:hypothetical protein
MPYAYPNATDNFGIFEYFQYIVGIEPLFFLIILIVMWAILFISTVRFGASKAYMFASFIVMILSILTVIMGFIPKQYMYITMIMVAFGVLFLRLENSYD